MQQRKRLAGRNKKTHYPKGRKAENAAIAEVTALISHMPIKRDLLIEYLHIIQDHYKGLYLRHLAALAEIMSLPLSEVFETSSFYAHFDHLEDDEKAPRLTIRVCDSLTCEMMGAQKLYEDIKNAFSGSDVKVVTAPCMGRCDQALAVETGHFHVTEACLEKVKKSVSEDSFSPLIPDYEDLSAYLSEGGYEAFKKCVKKKLAVDEIINELDLSGLKGFGGAGFPAASKWKFVRLEEKPRLVTINADEGEPGTFKDKYFFEKHPHRVLEGALIAAFCVEAQEIYIYLRDEYSGIHHILNEEIKKLHDMGLNYGIKIHLRRGAGAYICGEESAMLESIEGKRGLPRNRPPYISKFGLFGRPTLNNNVETLYWVPLILEKGWQWFSSMGRRGHKGPHSFSVSGRVNSPGVKIAPAGITMNELLREYCGNMQDGHEFYGYLPGGASGGILPSRLADIPLDFGTLEKYGCFIGSGAIIVLSQQDDIKNVALNLMRFFKYESCGQCTPCRCGTEKAVTLMQNQIWDKPLLQELTQVMTDASICGLGQAAGNPITSAIKYFAVK